jgi:hypothetical protein
MAYEESAYDVKCVSYFVTTTARNIFLSGKLMYQRYGQESLQNFVLTAR